MKLALCGLPITFASSSGAFGKKLCHGYVSSLAAFAD